MGKRINIKPVPLALLDKKRKKKESLAFDNLSKAVCSFLKVYDIIPIIIGPIEIADYRNTYQYELRINFKATGKVE